MKFNQIKGSRLGKHIFNQDDKRFNYLGDDMLLKYNEKFNEWYISNYFPVLSYFVV